MKKVLLYSILILATSCRVGDFTLISTKNVKSVSECVLLQSNVSAKAGDLKTAVDKCLEKVQGGQYLENCVISETLFGYKVKGDVWGKKP